MTPDRVAEGGEVQRVRRGSGRVIRQPGLLAVDDEPTLGQADRRTGTTRGADRRIQVVDSNVDRLADAGAVQTQAGKVLTELADTREEPLQHVALNLPCRVANDLALLAGEPLRALHADVVVVRDTQHVRATQGVGGLIARRTGARRPADLWAVGGRGPDAETSCGADGYQRCYSCE